MRLSEKLEISCSTKKETILSYIIYEWIVPLTIHFVYDEICLNLFSVFMAGLWLYSILFSVPQLGRLVW